MMNDFIESIYIWYTKNCRQLPWRETNDPYKIWISEIILQQTRVDQGMSYYHKFIKRFPTVSDLANANEDEILKLWQGLGYYSRARNMHETAKTIIKNYGGVFPNNYQNIIKLKGVGPYTAAAIASIAFGLPYPAIDGNIYRVLARYFGISNATDSTKGKNVFASVAKELIPDKNPGFHNQALMEFGALQCVPKSPNCAACPVVASCFAAENKKVAELPVKTKKTKQRERFFYYYLMEKGDDTWLEKRTENDIWKNLYQFPLIEKSKQLPEEELIHLEPDFLNGQPFKIKSISATQKHILSHQVIYARLIHIELDKSYQRNDRFVQISTKDIHTFAVPRLVENLIKQTEWL
ncbi:A/G-specific DNA-adenine glycosylase [Mariniphaga anaerophila]|uniref:Adenine DNA glycosylase n=1 Tax=Mariniphaga anaerophila TaxID=1484053 RepID=A0A1M4W6U7_9BACT|nr:A/G-specific adenine glycosylase [Mariniphaga anaerophila]SHE76991.1 A/G-specific DNA-adenine glycosylase [Mariniphaga anaerophila]